MAKLGGVDGRAVGSVAVISDVHAVLPALEAVLAEPDVQAADLIVATGDLFAGPEPVATLDLLTGLGDRVLLLRGNADRELVEIARGGQPAIEDPIATWAAGQLSAVQLAQIEALPQTATLDVTGLGPVFFCHATPRDDEEVVLVDSPLARWADIFAGLDPDVGTVVCGHTHMPFTRLAYRRLVVNPGSVGMSYGRSGAQWALLGPGVQLRRTLFDEDAACARLAERSAYPDIAEWADYFVRATAGDDEALAAFSPRVPAYPDPDAAKASTTAE
jgi:predicted phosphodiesterase